MDLNKLYEKQAELDKHILEKHNIKMSKEELLDNTTLALLVELGELANTTRCFKHWSTKGSMAKDIILDELADVWHFYLSIGNQISKFLTPLTIIETHHLLGKPDYNMIDTFLGIYNNTSVLVYGDPKGRGKTYGATGLLLLHLADLLGFTDKEVEQAYLKKHEENYKRQREGY